MEWVAGQRSITWARDGGKGRVWFGQSSEMLSSHQIESMRISWRIQSAEDDVRATMV